MSPGSSEVAQNVRELLSIQGPCTDRLHVLMHMAGGGAALMGAIMLGPRLGRFSKDGVVAYMRPASPTSQVLGTFILWFGWYGFNPGSTGKYSMNGNIHMKRKERYDISELQCLQGVPSSDWTEKSLTDCKPVVLC